MEEKGVKILAKNFRSRIGEVDLVALDGETLIFVEVKTWHIYGADNLEYSIGRQKRRRIIETAKYFLAVHREYNHMAVRFDIILIIPDNIIHLESAFTEET